MIKKGLSIIVLLIFLISMSSVITSPLINPIKHCVFNDLRDDVKENLEIYEKMANVPECKYTNDENACLECIEQKNIKNNENDQTNKIKGIIFMIIWVLFFIGSYGLMIYGLVQFLKNKKSLLFMILSTISSVILLMIMIFILLMNISV